MKTNSNIFTNALILGVAVLSIGGAVNAANREGRADNRRPAQVDRNYRAESSTRITQVERTAQELARSRDRERQLVDRADRRDRGILTRLNC